MGALIYYFPTVTYNMIRGSTFSQFIRRGCRYLTVLDTPGIYLVPIIIAIFIDTDLLALRTSLSISTIIPTHSITHYHRASPCIPYRLSYIHRQSSQRQAYVLPSVFVSFLSCLLSFLVGYIPFQISFSHNHLWGDRDGTI